MPIKKDEKIKLTPEELVTIENRRKINENLESFKAQYQKLVQETGFAWAVDVNSPLNNIQLGVAQVNVQNA